MKTITKELTLAAFFETEARFGIKTITKEANFGNQNNNKRVDPSGVFRNWGEIWYQNNNKRGEFW